MSRPVDLLSRPVGPAGHEPRPCIGARRIVCGESTPGERLTERRPAGGRCPMVRILTSDPGAARGTDERRLFRELAWSVFARVDGYRSRSLTARSVLHEAVRATKAGVVHTRDLVASPL